MKISNNLLYLDEINNLKKPLNEMFTDGNKPKKEQVYDLIYDMLVMSYAYGNTDVNLSLDSEVEIDRDKVDKAISQKIGGKTTLERVNEYVDANDIDSLVKVANVEGHRLYNQGAFDTAIKAGAKTKTWVDVGDDRVRDTHEYINGVTVDIGAEFTTFDGDHAQFPGGFVSPENNINCRCWLEYK